MGELLNRYLAKSEPIQTIQEHTDMLIEQLEVLKNTYPNIKYVDWDILYYACIYHDLGKMCSKFQNKLLKKIGEKEMVEDKFPFDEEIHHAYLSIYMIPRNYIAKVLKSKGYDEFSVESKIEALYQMVFYSHNRDRLEGEAKIKKVVKSEIYKFYERFEYDKLPIKENIHLSSYDYVKDRISLIALESLNVNIDEDKEVIDSIYQFVICKGLLNKLDYVASVNAGEIEKLNVEYANDSLEKSLKEFMHKHSLKLNDLQRFMVENRNESIIVRASTGIGKTEAGLFWIGDNKGLFVLPLKVAINSIYKRIISKIKFPRELAGILHSDTISEYMKNGNGLVDMNQVFLTKQMSLPLTVSTLDQFVDIVFKYDGYESKLASLSYSKLVIDEIQSFDPKLIAFLIVCLKYITDVGGKFAILTATLPPIITSFLYRELGDESFLDSPRAFIKKDKDGKSIKRHVVTSYKQDLDVKAILKNNNYKNKKVLVIVNTVKRAQELFNEMKELGVENVNLFHSRFIKRDRDNKETEILDFGSRHNNGTGIWITTQIVEASLDIDFDILHTELSDICGLFQRMGRVYRDRVYKSESSNVFVYLGDKKLPSGIFNGSNGGIIDYEIFNISRKYINGWKDTYISEEMKMETVDLIYSVENLKNSNYYFTIQDTIRKIKMVEDYKVRKKDIDLRGIKNESVIPLKIYNENKDVILTELENLKNSKQIQDKIKHRNKIYEYIASIDCRYVNKLQKGDLIAGELCVGKFEKIKIVDVDYTYEGGLNF